MDKSSVIFVIVGMIFGWPYAMLHFKALSLQWINTALWKRVLRTVLGISVAVGIYYFFQWVTSETNDIATKYFFGNLIPQFLTSFFIFGLFPILCKLIGLVQSDNEHAS